VIRNLVPVSTASRSKRSANRLLYQGNCARAGFPLAVRPFSTTSVPFVYAMLTCENIPSGRYRLHIRAKAQAITLYDREFD
jgi:hypothetical protein